MQDLLAARGGGGCWSCMLGVQDNDAAGANSAGAAALALAGTSFSDNPRMLSMLKEVRPLLAAAADGLMLESPSALPLSILHPPVALSKFNRSE